MVIIPCNIRRYTLRILLLLLQSQWLFFIIIIFGSFLFSLPVFVVLFCSLQLHAAYWSVFVLRSSSSSICIDAISYVAHTIVKQWRYTWTFFLSFFLHHPVVVIRKSPEELLVPIYTCFVLDFSPPFSISCFFSSYSLLFPSCCLLSVSLLLYFARHIVCLFFIFKSLVAVVAVFESNLRL